jgi:hypothetical protein
MSVVMRKLDRVVQIQRNGGFARQALCAQALKLFILQQGDAL